MKKSVKTTLAMLLGILLLFFQLVVNGYPWGLEEIPALDIISKSIPLVVAMLIVYMGFACINESEKLSGALAQKDRQIERTIKNSKIDFEEQEQRIYRIRQKHIKRFNALSKEIARMQLIAEDLEQELKLLTDRYERAKKLHPNLDDEIDAMIEEEAKREDMRIAGVFDARAREAVRIYKNVNVTEKVRQVLEEYDGLTDRQKSYVRSDIPKLKKLYENSIEKQKQTEAKEGETEPKDAKEQED